MTTTIEVTSFYRFLPLPFESITAAKSELEELANTLSSLKGLIIIATEGINGTIAGSKSEVDLFQEALPQIFSVEDWDFKRSRCNRPPFRSFRVKQRNEIVTTRDESGFADDSKDGKLSVDDWHTAMQNFDPEQSVLIDTRNTYETQLGMFEHAIDPRLDNFQEFERVIADSGIPKEKTIYMYCTGGIRCEKASVQMKRLGYKNVYQLDGGILRYLERFPGESFHGECFVFDGRVALDQQLNPTNSWVFCPHCGDPGDVEIACGRCGCSAKICRQCLPQEYRSTCSKDCAYQLRIRRSRAGKAAA